MTHLIRKLTVLMSLLFFSRASAAEIAQLLEMGRLDEVRSKIASMDVRPREAGFLSAQLHFYSQEYDQALAALPKDDPKIPEIGRLRTLIERTAEATRSFKTIDTPHFRFRVAPGKDEILIPYLSDALEAGRSRVAANLGVPPPEKLTVEIYPAWKDFITVSTLSEKEVRTTGTIALCKFNRLIVTTPRALLKGYDWLDTATHEYTHYLINRATDASAPVWLHEGIAKYEEVRWRMEEGSEIPPELSALLGRRFQKGTLLPLKALHPSIAKLPSAEDAQLAFGQVFYLVKYLVEEKGGFAKFREVLAHMKSGEDVSDAFRNIYGKPLTTIEEEWKVWIQTKKLPTNSIRSGRSFDLAGADEKSGEQRELAKLKEEKVRDRVRLGDLLLSHERFDAALSEFEQALTSVKTPPAFLHQKVARAAIGAGKKERATKALDEALRISTSDVTTITLRGQLRAAAGDWAGAKTDFLAANAILPFDPAIHEGLLTVYKNDNDKNGVDREESVLKILQEAASYSRKL